MVAITALVGSVHGFCPGLTIRKTMHTRQAPQAAHAQCKGAHCPTERDVLKFIVARWAKMLPSSSSSRCCAAEVVETVHLEPVEMFARLVKPVNGEEHECGLNE